ncbi:hypothetical protein V5P93_005649 [Actinokineospora auranticolor]|uniref:Uncharacterized protein n=1 Tax=Actinokineospora auranticolor TaxID=155976 RepID=A0A2S6GF05_9PSEU|nr:hypothetical protein [Actinokineospora auranticolor]PPK63780.1 hypothetical protein CLV40_12420 [Actinokineospora auranticolor]
MSTSDVVVVDLRGGGVAPADPAGGVVVVDDAADLVAHAETYMSLVGADMVTAVVCLAVGEAATGDPLDGVVLTLPPALRHATVLWIGNPTGVEWAPDSAAPRPAAHRGDTLDSLVAALRDPHLFDRVIAAAEELPASAANPGVRLVSHSADLAELAEARAAAVRSLCAGDQPATHDLSAGLGRTPLLSGQIGVVLSGPVQAARADAVRRLAEVERLAGVLGTVKALLGTARSTAGLSDQVVWAGQAAENYRAGVVELLNRVDGHLQVGDPSVESVREMGVPAPREADPAEVTRHLRTVVDERLRAGAALPAVARELRQLVATSRPQGCMAALDEARAIGPLSLTAPGFRRWPLGLGALPVVFLSCAAMVYLLGPGWSGWLAGVLLAAAWTGAGWLLLARRPGVDSFSATAPPAFGVYGSTALGGAVLAGIGLVFTTPKRMPPLVADIVAVALVLVCFAVVATSWKAAARRWQAALRVAPVRDAISQLTRIAEDTASQAWLPVERKRAIAAAATAVADGVHEVANALADAGNRLFLAPDTASGGGAEQMARPVPRELYTVVRGDLLDVCRAALDPAWPAAEAATRTAAGVYAQRLERLLGEYGAEVRGRGLLSATGFSSDQATRDELLVRTWQESPAALAALRTRVDDDMTQLCAGGHLRYLNRTASPQLVRFAPARLRVALGRDSVHSGVSNDPGIAWSGAGEFVGALRLLPLRSESVRHAPGGSDK